LSSLVLSLIGSLAVYKVNRFVINYCLDKVIRNDAKFFNKESKTIILSDYFLRFDFSKKNEKFQNFEKSLKVINSSYYHDNDNLFELAAEERQFLPCHVGNPNPGGDDSHSQEKYKELPLTDKISDRTMNEKNTEISSRIYHNLQGNNHSHYNANNTNDPSYISDLSRFGVSSASHSSRKFLINVDDDIKNYIMFKQKLDSSYNSSQKHENENEINLDLTKFNKDKVKERGITPILSPIEKLSVLCQLKNYAILNSKKSSTNPYINNPNHQITIKDYQELTIYELAFYDKRTFWLLYWDLLMEDHILLNVIFKRSIMDPLWIRLIYIVFNLSIMFALNALFFSDDLIDIRATVDETQRVRKLFLKILNKKISFSLFRILYFTL
jgi:hypothetical protein